MYAQKNHIRDRSADTKIYNVVHTVKTLHPQAAPKAEPKLGAQQADQKIQAHARGMIHSARNVTSDQANRPYTGQGTQEAMTSARYVKVCTGALLSVSSSLEL